MGGAQRGVFCSFTSPVCPTQIISWNTSILIIVSSPGPRLSPGPGAQRAPMSPCPVETQRVFQRFQGSEFSLTFPSPHPASPPRQAPELHPNLGPGHRAWLERPAEECLGGPRGGANAGPGTEDCPRVETGNVTAPPGSPQRSEWVILETNADGSPLECVQTRPGRKLEERQ